MEHLKQRRTNIALILFFVIYSVFSYVYLLSHQTGICAYEDYKANGCLNFPADFVFEPLLVFGIFTIPSLTLSMFLPKKFVRIWIFFFAFWLVGSLVFMFASNPVAPHGWAVSYGSDRLWSGFISNFVLFPVTVIWLAIYWLRVWLRTRKKA